MKRGYSVCFRKAFGDAANTQTYIVRASFVRLTLLLRAVATKLLIIYEEGLFFVTPSGFVPVWLFL